MKTFFIKVSAFAGLVAVFWLLGGFEIGSDIQNSDWRGRRYILRAWSMTILLYFVGIALLVWPEEIDDIFCSEIPAAGYRIIGGLLAFAGGLWMLMLKNG